MQSTPVTQKDVVRLHEAAMKEMAKMLADIKKLLEKQKIGEEQERLKKIQVCHPLLTHRYKLNS